MCGDIKKLVFIGILSVLAFGGCGGGGKHEKVTIRYFRWADPSEIQATREVIDLFEKEYPNIKVKLEFAPWSEYWSKLQSQIAAGNAPDVFMISGFYFNDFASKGILMDLTPLINRDNLSLDGFFEIPLRVFTYNSHLYALPRDYNVVVLFYNKKLFDKAGINYPDTTWTWDKFREVAKKLTRDFDKDGRVDQYGFLVENDLEVCWGNFVLQNGGEILDTLSYRCLLDTPEAVEAFKFLWNLMYKDKSAPTSTQLTAQTDPFLTGRVAMRIGGSWNLRRYNVPEISYGITYLPRGKRRGAFANGTGNAIYYKTKNLDAAWKLVKFFSSPEAQIKLAETGTSIPALKNVALSDEYARIVRKFNVDPHIFWGSFKFSHKLPFTPHYSEWIDAVTQELEKMWLGKEPVEQAARKAALKANKILEQIGSKKN